MRVVGDESGNEGEYPVLLIGLMILIVEVFAVCRALAQFQLSKHISQFSAIFFETISTPGKMYAIIFLPMFLQALTLLFFCNYATC